MAGTLRQEGSDASGATALPFTDDRHAGQRGTVTGHRSGVGRRRSVRGQQIEHHLIVALDIASLPKAEFNSLSAQLIDLRRMAYGLRTRLQRLASDNVTPRLSEAFM